MVKILFLLKKQSQSMQITQTKLIQKTTDDIENLNYLTLIKM